MPHATNETCPICNETAVQRVRCSHASCTFFVITCPKCDKEQDVRAFLADHEKDCQAQPVAPTIRRVA